ncbi:VP91 [Macrobrachium rosenbergii nudivirus]|nr:VP91 [Macrobrachium rosenbergii nudivirus]
MDIIIYTIIAIILFIIIIIYYILNKPKRVDLLKTYENQLLTTKDPIYAFTHKKLPDGTFENYYMNYDTEEAGLLKREINTFPVTKTGESYKTHEHGTVITTKDGFTISGINTKFNCPSNWFWHETEHVCKVIPFCGSDDTGLIKGVDYYNFHTNNFQKELNKKSKEKQVMATKNDIAYHKRLYVTCLEDESFKIDTCPDNMLYNQLESQSGTVNPCNLYDVCNEMLNYTVHLNKIDDYNLEENEYYVCIDGVSNLRKCRDDLSFDVTTKACIERDRCFDKPDDYTFYNDERSYFICKNKKEHTVNCRFGVFENPDMSYVCKIDNTDGYITYYKSDYMTYPISAYQYDYTTNTRIEIDVSDRMSTCSFPLDPTTHPFFSLPRQAALYPPIEYNTYVLKYKDPELKDLVLKEEFTNKNYKEYQTLNNITVCWFNGLLEYFSWNIFEDIPLVQTEYKYYKHNKQIKDKTNASFTVPSQDYFYFITANKLFTPISTSCSEKVFDPATGIFMYADVFVPADPLKTDPKVNTSFTVLKMTKPNKNNYIMYTYDYRKNQLQAIVWRQEVINKKSFVLDANGKPVCVLFKYNPIKIKVPTNIYIRLNCIQWSGMTSSNENYVFPSILSILNTNNFTLLNEQFTLLDPVSLTGDTTLISYINKVESTFTEITTFTGTSEYFTDILNSLTTFLNVK